MKFLGKGSKRILWDGKKLPWVNKVSFQDIMLFLPKEFTILSEEEKILPELGVWVLSYLSLFLLLSQFEFESFV